MPLLEFCELNQVPVITHTGVVDCDCDDGFYYWPEDDSCYQLYTTGPCKPDEVLVMSQVGGSRRPEEEDGSRRPHAAAAGGGGPPGGRQPEPRSRRMRCARNPCGKRLVAYSEEFGYCFKLGAHEHS